MKPNYALNLTHDGIDLFERAEGGWNSLGTVSLEAADLDGAIEALRRLAERRAPKGATAKLMIPPSQVLYSRIKAPGPSAAQRKRQIAHALDGRTPYAVSDLAFDWSGTGEEVMVAVVAKETLAEAEDFARTYGFAALSFVTQPEPDQFAGEPWFGTTKMAAQYLGAGERVERDQDPVRVIGAIAVDPVDLEEKSADTKDAAAPPEIADERADEAPTVAVESPAAPESPAALETLECAKPEATMPPAHDSDADAGEPASPHATTPHPTEAAAQQTLFALDAETPEAPSEAELEAILGETPPNMVALRMVAPDETEQNGQEPEDGLLADPEAFAAELSPATEPAPAPSQPDWLESASMETLPADVPSKGAAEPASPQPTAADVAITQPDPAPHTAPDAAPTEVPTEAPTEQDIAAQSLDPIAQAPIAQALSEALPEELPETLSQELIETFGAPNAPIESQETAIETALDPVQAAAITPALPDAEGQAAQAADIRNAGDSQSSGASQNFDAPEQAEGAADPARAPQNPASQNPAPQTASGIIARPTFAARRQTPAPKAPPQPGAPAFEAPEAELTDTRFTAPPTKPLDDKQRAAIPRITPMPARLDVPTPRIMPFGGPLAQPEARPQTGAQTGAQTPPAAASKTSTTARARGLGKDLAGGLAKGAASASSTIGGWAARFKRPAQTDTTTASQEATRRPGDAAAPLPRMTPRGPHQPIAQEASAPETARLDTAANLDTAAKTESTRETAAPMAPPLSAQAPTAPSLAGPLAAPPAGPLATQSADTTTDIAASIRTGNPTQPPAAVRPDIRPEAHPNAHPDTHLASEAVLSRREEGSNVSPLLDEAPFAGDVELLAPLPAAPIAPVRGDRPQREQNTRNAAARAKKPARTVFGAPKSDAKAGRSAGQATGSRFLMAKLVGVLLLFMGGIALWDSYLSGSDAPQLAQTAPSTDPLSPAQTTLTAADQATAAQGNQLAQGGQLALGDQLAAERGTTGGALGAAGGGLARPDVETAQAAPQTGTPSDAASAENAGTAPAADPANPLAPENTLAGLSTSTAPALPDAEQTGAEQTGGAQTDGEQPGINGELAAQTEPGQANSGQETASAPIPSDPIPTAAPSFTDVAPIIPTVSGTVTPTGAVIFAGRPSVVPPARPASVTKAAAAAAAAAAFPQADPALKGQRPKARPASVEAAASRAAQTAPETAPAPTEAAQTQATPATAATAEATPEANAAANSAANSAATAPVDTAAAAAISPEEAALRTSRPKQRPAAINTAAARAADAAKAEAEAAAKAEEAARIAAEAEAQKFAGATPQAVETSRRPGAKPRNIARAVEAAVAAAVANTPREAPKAAPQAPAQTAPVVVASAAPAPVPAATPAPKPTRAPSAAPEPTVMKAPKQAAAAAAVDELDEPEPTAPTRSGATSGTVAKQATEKNALNLGKVNLIGLFGAKSNRRGLVRMPNGSFVRVKVGDRLDGGQVTAIGDGQLSYQKGGRNVTLKLLAGG